MKLLLNLYKFIFNKMTETYIHGAEFSVYMGLFLILTCSLITVMWFLLIHYPQVVLVTGIYQLFKWHKPILNHLNRGREEFLEFSKSQEEED